MNELKFINGGTLLMTTGTLSFNIEGGSITTYAYPLNPLLPVSASNPLSPATALISGGTVALNQNTTNNGFIIEDNVTGGGSSGTLANPSQTISLTNATGGNFTLALGTATTAPITFSTASATLASNIQAALNLLSTITALGNPATTSVAATGTTATVTFLGATPGVYIPSLTANILPDTNAAQNLLFPTGLSSGTFTITYNSQTTAPITYSSVTATLQSSIQSALNLMSTFGAPIRSKSSASPASHGWELHPGLQRHRFRRQRQRRYRGRSFTAPPRPPCNPTFRLSSTRSWAWETRWFPLLPPVP